jgi:hypothetical protein
MGNDEVPAIFVRALISHLGSRLRYSSIERDLGAESETSSVTKNM